MGSCREKTANKMCQYVCRIMVLFAFPVGLFFVCFIVMSRFVVWRKNYCGSWYSCTISQCYTATRGQPTQCSNSLRQQDEMGLSHESAWHEWGFMLPMCKYRLNRARTTPRGWWDDTAWPDTGFEIRSRRSEVHHATSPDSVTRLRRLPTILIIWGIL